MAASFLVYVPTASAAPGDPITSLSATQCENGGPPSTSKACPGGWVSGSLNSTNSHYREDEVVPQRLLMTIPAGGDTHTLTISYMARKKGGSNAHAFDYLATWDHTQSDATPCQGLAAAICSGSPSTLQMASDTTSVQPVGSGISADTSTHELSAGDREWKMYGAATLDGTSAVTHTEPTDTGKDDIASVTLNITGSAAGGQALLLFGGHLAVSGVSTVPRAWGPSMGASAVSGGPYHIGLSAVDGKKATAQNNIQAGAVQPLDPAAFTIEKTVDDETPTPGQTVTYTVTVTNTGEESGSTTFVDDYDDSLNPGDVTSSPAGGTCTEGGGTLTCQTSSIGPGDSQTFTYSATIPEALEGEPGTGGCDPGSFPITNTAALAGGTGEDSVTLCVPAAAEFTIEKTVDDDTATPEQELTYTITVTNNGSTSGSTSFVDDFDDSINPGDVTTAPAGGTCEESGGTLTCQTSSIAPGNQQTFTYKATMPKTFSGESGAGGCATGSFPITNTATIDGEGGDEDSVTVCVAAAPKFTIEKTVDDETAIPEQEVTYTITVTNTGSTSGSTTFTDDFDDRLDPGDVTSTPEGGSCAELLGQLACQTSSIAPGDTQTFTYTAKVPKTFQGESGTGGCDPGSFPVTNTATLPDEAGDDSATVCVAAAPEFTIEKTVDDATAIPEQAVTYTITVTNTGAAPGSTSFLDDFDNRLDPGEVTTDPAGGTCTDDGDTLSCETTSIAAGETQTFTYTANVPKTFEGESGTGGCNAGEFPISNTATIDGEGGDDDSATVCVAAAPEFTIEKTVDDETPEPDQEVTYTITVTNTGSTSGSTSFDDEFDGSLDPSEVTSDPEGGTCVEDGNILSCDTSSIAPGSAQTFTYTARIPKTFEGESGTGGCDPGSFAISNTATLDGEEGGDDSVTVCVAAAPKFTIEKMADDETAIPEQVVTYTITVTNNGSTSGSTSFVDDFDDRLDPGEVTTDPAGGTCADDGSTLSCETSSIAPGNTQTFTYTAKVPKTFEGESGTGGCETGFFPIPNTATLAGEDGDDDSVTVCVEAAPKFTIEKVADDLTAIPEQEITYTITVTNTGSTSGSTSFVDDYDNTLDPGEVTSDPEGGTCTDDGDTLSCDTSSLAPEGSQTFTYKVTLPKTFEGESGTDGCQPGEFPIANTAALGGGGDSTVTVCVAAAPKFTIEKTVDDETPDPEQEVTYTIKVTNTGSTTGSTSFVDNYDDSLNPGEVTSDPEGGTCNDDGDTVSCDTSSIAPGNSQTFTYKATIPATFDGESGTGGCDPGSFPITNTATLAGDAGADSATACVAAAPTFTIEKTIDDTTPERGQAVTYTITVTNTGTASGTTSFVDDYDDSLDPSLPTSDPAGGECTAAESGNEAFTCQTGTILAKDKQTFTYTATLPLTFDGESGGGDCEPGTFPIENTATLDGEAGNDGVTVCIEASPDLSVTKSADDDTPTPGQEVTYTIMVENNGSAPGSTSFVDDFDDRLDPSTPESEGGTCELVTEGDNKTFECQTGTIPAGGVQTFTYTATMPATFSGASGDAPCEPGSYPVVNDVTLDGGEPQTVTVCVTAAPELKLNKSVETDFDSSGHEFLTYTLEYTNDGPAEAPSALINDEIPEGTVFEDCSDECDTTGDPVSSATWAVGPIAAKGGTGKVTLVVRVVTKDSCEVTNVATIQFGLAPPISSNTVVTPVSPKADPDGAHANGSAKGAQVLASGLIRLSPKLQEPISTAATSQSGPGGPQLDDETILSLKVPSNGSLLKADALRTTSSSVVTASPAEARQTSTAEVANVCVVPIAGKCTVEASTVRAVASTIANGGTASASSAGSTIQNLKVVGLDTPVDLNQTTKIPLNKAIFGAGSYVAINERTGPGGQPHAGLSDGTYSADLTVTMIHVKITGALGLQAAEVIVSQATAHSDFPETHGCGTTHNNTVSGHAFVAGLFTGPLLADLLQGYTQISPLGGSESEHIADLKIPGNGAIVSAKVADSTSEGAVSSLNATSSTFAEVAGDGESTLCILRGGTLCVVMAKVIRSASQSTANASGASSSDSGSTLLGFQIGDSPPYKAGQPPTNHTVPLPGIGFIILNEQFCDGGTTASHTCSGATHSGLTVRALRIVVNIPDNVLGLKPGVELIVAEAHSDATFN